MGRKPKDDQGPRDMDEPVSLAPLDPDEALAALLATEADDQAKEDERDG